MDMGQRKYMSKSRILVIVTILTVSAIVAIGLGLGLGLRKRNDEIDDANSNGCPQQVTGKQPTSTTPAPTTTSPLYNPPSDSKEERYRFAAVSADAEECSQIGTRVMARDGGSAVDAAIAAILCLGVYNGQSSGIGGGHFLTYYHRANKTAYSIIAREQAPSGATADMFVPENVSSTIGGKAIGIPGEVRGLYEAHKLGGKLPWKQLFQPAIKLCRDGFRVGRGLAIGISHQEEVVKTNKNLRDLLTNPATNQLYKEGELMKRPLLAKTLEIIADEGPDAFYNGSLTINITLDIQEAGGIITESDLANYTAKVKQPLEFVLNDNSKAHSPPPPSSGAVYLLILNILNGYKFTSTDMASINSASLTWHRIIEAFKHAFSERTQLGDYDVGSDSFKRYVTDLVTNMTRPSYGAAKRSYIDDSRTYDPSYYNPSFSVKWDHGTAHLSVLGPEGDAVSVSSTVNLYFGSKVVGSRTGIIFNNEMDDFSTPNTTNYFGVPASPANYIAPWKRPMSSMCPSIVVSSDGDVKLVVGASGGTKITTSTALVTMETLWFNWGIKEAIDYPRLHHQLFPSYIIAEPSFPQEIQDKLKEKGHNITVMDFFGNAVQGILTLGEENITANSGFRKYGKPDGY